MKTRIITAVVAVAVLIPFLIFSGTFAFNIFSLLLSVVAMYEIIFVTGFKKNVAVNVIMYIYALLMSLCVRCAFLPNYFIISAALTFLMIFAVFTASVFSHGKAGITDVCILAAFSFYAELGINSLVLLRDLNNGQYIYLIALFAPWLCDTFAYFGGSFFGKHKLIPDVSPKKTVEGAISGVVLGTAGVIVYGIVVSSVFSVKTNYVILGITAFILTFVSQIGDLCASVIKRHYGIKDYGFIFPGHGGVLDRFDSVIACAGILYIICFFISTFGGSAFAIFS